MGIKPAGVVIDGIDDERKYRRLRACCAGDRVEDEGGTETLPRVPRRHGEATDEASWQQRITRQTVRQISGEIGHRQAAGRERVVARYFAAGTDRDETVGQAAADILRNLLVEVTIERLDATREAASVVGAS